MIQSLLIVVAIVALLLFLNAFYVAGEFAAVTARRTRLVQQAEAGSQLARMMLVVVEDPHRLDNYIAASQVGITISSIVLGIYGQQALAPRFEPLVQSIPFVSGEAAAAGVAATLVLFILTTFQIVLGELVPKVLALRYPERVALATVVPMRWSADLVLRPLIIVLNGSATLLLRPFGVEFGGGHAHVHSPEEIEILVGESHRAGLLDGDERQLLQNAFRIGELSASDIMIPRNRLITAPVDSSARALLESAAASSYTRIPLYEEDVDHLAGFVHLKDLFRLYHEAGDAGDVRAILRTAPYVPETMPVTDVWQLLNKKRSYLAIVFDEYGGTAGIITQEDLIEELFGEVQDEFDQEGVLISREDNGQLVVRGDMGITHLADLLDVRLTSVTANTVGGLVLEALGRVPVTGDKIEIEGLHFEIEAVQGRSVRSLRVTPGADAPEEVGS